MFSLVLAIMAGGSSSRMGTDKALLDAGHGPNLERLASLGLAHNLPVFIVGREQSTNWQQKNVHFIPDKITGQGPLGGIVAVLEQTEAAICIACDFFLLEATAISWLIEHAIQCRNNNHIGFAVMSVNGVEPLCACYTTACFDEALRRLKNGERALHKLIEAVDMQKIQSPPWMLPQLRNINTRDDWLRFQQQQAQQ